MGRLKLLGISLVFMVVMGRAAPSEAACEAVGEIQFICDLIGPEDLAIVPVASG